MSRVDDDVTLTDDVGRDLGKGHDDFIRLRGHFRSEVFGPDGRLKSVREVDNLVTTVGRNFIVEQLLAAPTASTKPTHMGVGTGSVAAALGDSSLTSEVRVALTSKSRTGNVLTMVGDWPAGSATQANTEAGLWDAASGGNLHARATFGAQTKGANDTLKNTWTWTIG